MKLPPFFQKDKILSELSTFRVGGKTKYYVTATTSQLLLETLEYCQKFQIPYFILGKGSNCLFDDLGFDGVMIHNRIDFIHRPKPGQFHVGAGFPFSRLGIISAKESFSGLEFASGIPGSVGGAVFMNAGANGNEVQNALESVEFLNQDGSIRHYLKNSLSFSYRHSPFQKQKGVILSATFKLSLCNKARQTQMNLLAHRKSTQPLSHHSAGCIFRNPQTESAGSLIDRLGLKGKCIGKAKISDIHANFMINTGGATSDNIKELISFVQNEALEKTGIELKQEVIIVPYHGKLL